VIVSQHSLKAKTSWRGWWFCMKCSMNSRDLDSKGVMFKIDFEKAYDKVRWDFVPEVLREKGFPKTWIQ
jgi:hypothetical protein